VVFGKGHSLSKRLLFVWSEDFPEKHRAEFKENVGQIYFRHRNIKDVCEHLFSHPSFWNAIINQLSIYTRDGKRVYRDLDSGEHWKSIQV
jgi:hypothetical protein